VRKTNGLYGSQNVLSGKALKSNCRNLDPSYHLKVKRTTHSKSLNACGLSTIIYFSVILWVWNGRIHCIATLIFEKAYLQQVRLFILWKKTLFCALMFLIRLGKMSRSDLFQHCFR